MSLIKFLYEVDDIEVLLKIKREINGEAPDDDESEEEEEEEKEEEEEQAEEEEEKAVRRLQSPTLWSILRRYYTEEIPAATMDWSCFLLFFKTTVSQLDMKDYAIMDGYLRTLSQFILYANRLHSRSLRNNFSNVVAIGKGYFAGKYGLSSKKFTEVVEGHWRPILKVNKDIRGMQLKMKYEALAKRTKNQYEMDWDYYQTVLKRYSQCLYIDDFEFSTTDAIKLIICVEGNTACRKTEVLDPIIEFHTGARDWMRQEWNKRISCLVTTWRVSRHWARRW